MRAELRCLLLLAPLVAGCASTLDPKAFRTWEVVGAEAPPAAPPARELDFHGIPLRSGQIVTSEQGSPQSLFLSLMVAESFPWVHSGVLAIEDGQAWLYEAQGTLSPNLLTGAPPNRNLGGGVRRVPLEQFIARQRFVGIHDPPRGADAAAVARYARERFAAGTPFDGYFDLGDPSRVYCGEFTTLALEAGGAGLRYRSPLTANPSVRVVTDWLAVRADEILPAGAIVRDAPLVARISARHTAAQMEAYFAARAELHRRFTADQSLGNVLSFTPIRLLQFRPAVRAFLNRVNDESADWVVTSSDDLEARVRAIAQNELGPFPGPAVAKSRE
jgi:hypothetical protein